MTAIHKTNILFGFDSFLTHIYEIKPTFKYNPERWTGKQKILLWDHYKTLEMWGGGKPLIFGFQESARKINTKRTNHTNKLFPLIYYLAVYMEAHQDNSKSLNQILIPYCL